MKKSISRYEHILLSLIIFTLPFNWFLKWESDSAFLRGIRIDYLLPKIYLQDILLFCLVFYLLYSNRHQIAFRIKQKFIRSSTTISNHDNKHALAAKLTNLAHTLTKNLTSALFMSLALVVGLRTVVTQQASSYAGFFQLISAIGFGYYLFKRFSFDRLLNYIWKPLIASVLFQSIFGIYQFIFQKSLVGYTLFGEIDLSLPGAIVRESFFGVLRVLPYGTLPHPNLLAGFLGTTSLILLLKFQFVRAKGKNIILKYVSLGLLFVTLLLTRSWVAIGGIIGLLFSSYLFGRYRHVMLVCLYSLITLVYISLPAWSVYQSIIETSNISIIRRVKLNQAGISVLKDHLWFGTGLNQSLIPMHSTYSLLTPPDFIQPIHSIYLLWLVEVGFVGATLTCLLVLGMAKSTTNQQPLLQSVKVFSNRENRLFWLDPLLFIAWLGIFDHYILSIRQGQLLAAIAIALAFSFASNTKK